MFHHETWLGARILKNEESAGHVMVLFARDFRGNVNLACKTRKYRGIGRPYNPINRLVSLASLSTRWNKFHLTRKRFTTFTIFSTTRNAYGTPLHNKKTRSAPYFVDCGELLRSSPCSTFLRKSARHRASRQHPAKAVTSLLGPATP